MGNFLSGIGNIAKKVGKFSNNAIDFVGKLPNEIIDFGNKVGDTIYGKGRDAQGSFQTFKKQGQQFESRKAGASLGSFINDNSTIIVIAVIVFFLFKN